MTSAPVTETENPGFENNSLTMTPPACRDAPCIFYAVMNSLIFILGVAGNGLVIWIAGFKIKKSVNSIWYLSLAVSDFIFCSSLPLGIVHVVKDDWIFGLFLCKFLFFSMYLTWFSSIFLLVIISVDRCVVVKFPVWAQNQRTVKKASVMVMIAWIISAVLSTPSVLNLVVMYDKHKQSRVCFDNYSNEQHHVIDVVFRLIFGFVVPYLIIVICYVLIMRKMKSNRLVRSKKPLKIMTVLIVAFLICWLPYNTFALIEIINKNGISNLLPGVTVAVVFANANSCINPFLYAFMGKDIKDQCCAVLSKIENAIEEQESHFRTHGTATTTSGENMDSAKDCSGIVRCTVKNLSF